jgi:hypothetical protein
MNVSDEGNQLCIEVAKLRRDTCRRYSPDLRRRILDWVERSVAAGIKETSCARSLGVKAARELCQKNHVAVAANAFWAP